MSAEDIELEIGVKVQVLGRFAIAKEILKCVLLAAICGLVLTGTALLWKLPKAIHAEADATRAALVAQVHIATEDANAQIADALSKADAQLTGLRADMRPALQVATAKVAALDVDGFNRSVAAIGPAFTSAGAALADTAASVDSTTKPLAASLEQFEQIVPYFTDCQEDETGVGNKSCLPVRYADLTSSLDRTLSAIAQAAPATAKSVAAITEDGHKITADAAKMADKYTQPPTVWQKIAGVFEIFGYVVLKALI